MLVLEGIPLFLIELGIGQKMRLGSLGSPLPWASCPQLANGSAVPECEKSSETAYFWYRTTLDVSPAIDQPEGLKWWIVLCLILAWTIVFFIVMKGIQSSGKVVYFTSLFPYIVLTIFFIRGITLKGASAGLAHMYTPKVSDRKEIIGSSGTYSVLTSDNALRDVTK
ncbi:unnamed protein product [Bemisia tabaci]|uniref:Uncharacterized protein n=1 Tax=Bemisia tabaci TaxID=7038 RepID=A0A9P0AAF8_BEMTA|nr:unnamed protein product [Bemisia tabaci]